MELDLDALSKIITSLVVIIGVIPALLNTIPSQEQITTLTRKSARIDDLIIFCFEVLDRKDLRPSDGLMIEHKFNKISGRYCDYRVILEIVKLPNRYNLIKTYCLNRGAIELYNEKIFIPKEQQDRNLFNLAFFYLLYVASAIFITLYGIHVPPELELSIFDFSINAKLLIIVGSSIPCLSSILIIKKLTQRHNYIIKFSSTTDSEINRTDWYLTISRYLFIVTLAYEITKIIMKNTSLILERSKNSSKS